VEGFKPNVKMKSDISCYKEGGYVSRKKHSEEKEEAKDIAKDKAMIKKAVGQHEGSKHKGEEKTELKLKTGRRVKKTGGVVNKYKTGGLCNPMKTGGVANVKKEGGAIEMKKGKDDKKAIAQTKKTKAGKADAPSAATGKKKESPATGNRPAKKTMTASSVGALPEAAGAESAAMSMPENQPIEMMAAGGYMDGGTISDYDSTMISRAPMAEPIVRPRTPSGGMGAAMPSGPMGNAAPLGVISDQERQIMRGLQALGQYADGGRTC
jgi:hypothetical protein